MIYYTHEHTHANTKTSFILYRIKVLNRKLFGYCFVSKLFSILHINYLDNIIFFKSLRHYIATNQAKRKPIIKIKLRNIFFLLCLDAINNNSENRQVQTNTLNIFFCFFSKKNSYFHSMMMMNICCCWCFACLLQPIVFETQMQNAKNE